MSRFAFVFALAAALSTRARAQGAPLRVGALSSAATRAVVKAGSQLDGPSTPAPRGGTPAAAPQLVASHGSAAVAAAQPKGAVAPGAPAPNTAVAPVHRAPAAPVAVAAPTPRPTPAAAPAPASAPPVAAAPGAAKPALGAAVSNSSATKSEVAFLRETYTYDPANRRDPFLSLMSTGDLRPALQDLRLVGVAYDPTGRNSVAVMRDMSTKDQYRVKVGQSLGRMRVAQIQPKSVVFTIEEFGYSRQETLALGDLTKARSQ